MVVGAAVCCMSVLRRAWLSILYVVDMTVDGWVRRPWAERKVSAKLPTVCALRVEDRENMPWYGCWYC